MSQKFGADKLGVLTRSGGNLFLAPSNFTIGGKRAYTIVSSTIPLPSFVAGDTIADELVLCQRYYEKSMDIDTPPGSTIHSDFFEITTYGTTTYRRSIDFRVEKRGNASVRFYAGSGSPAGGVISSNGTQYGAGNATSNTRGFVCGATIGTSGVSDTRWGWAADAEL